MSCSSSCDFRPFIPRFDKSSLKRGLCRRRGMNGQSWNSQNHQVARQICPTTALLQVQESMNRIVKQFYQSNIFVNQMLSMWKLLSTQIKYWASQICIFLHLFIVTTSIVQNVEKKNEIHLTIFIRILFLSLSKLIQLELLMIHFSLYQDLGLF